MAHLVLALLGQLFHYLKPNFFHSALTGELRVRGVCWDELPSAVFIGWNLRGTICAGCPNSPHFTQNWLRKWQKKKKKDGDWREFCIFRWRTYRIPTVPSAECPSCSSLTPTVNPNVSWTDWLVTLSSSAIVVIGSCQVGLPTQFLKCILIWSIERERSSTALSDCY